RWPALAGASGAEAGVGVLHGLGELRPARHGLRAVALTAGRERAQRGEAIGVAQRAAERRARVLEADAADFGGELVHQRTELPRPDERAEERVAATDHFRNDREVRDLGRTDREVLEVVDRTQHRGPARVVQQTGEVAVERIEVVWAGDRRGEPRLAVGVLPDLRRRARRQ